MGSVENLGLLHDLTHSGMTHALQMLDEEGCIGPRYSDKNQTLLLWLAVKAVMFATMTWPGVEQKYCREIEQRAERISQLKTSGNHILETPPPEFAKTAGGTAASRCRLNQLKNIWEPHIGNPTA